jgi:hypothetical protein
LQAVICLLSLAWCAAVGAGFYALESYTATPGDQAAPPGQWPEGSPVQRIPGRHNLVIALHPRCPCSRASVAELERILALAPTPVCVHVLAYEPASAAPDDQWRDTDLVRRVRRIPGVFIWADVDATEARRFGARTSGDVLLYGPDGTLLFHGGLTSARGHEGESAAHEALGPLLRGEKCERSETPVFGCPLVPQCRQVSP